MSLSIRPARPGDAALALAFVRELAACQMLQHGFEASEAMIDAALLGEGPRAFCDIAEWGGEPVDLAEWFLNFSSFRGRCGIYLQEIFVRPSHRGRGFGTALLRRLAALGLRQGFLRQGFARLEWAVLHWSAPSIAFHEARRAALLCDWTICRASGEALAKLAGEEAG